MSSGVTGSAPSPTGPMPRCRLPTVSIILPVLNEETQLERCLRSVAEQTYPAVVEIIVADGGSTDGTRDRSRQDSTRCRVVDNPTAYPPRRPECGNRRRSGDIIVRVDARTALSRPITSSAASRRSSGRGRPSSAARCATRPTMRAQRGIVAAMTSRLGAGPAAFRREGGEPRFVDTVYLGAFRAETIRSIGGYDEWSGGNEDAELAWRAQPSAASISTRRSSPTTSAATGSDRWRASSTVTATTGHGRSASTLRRFPAPARRPGVVLGFASPWRRPVLADLSRRQCSGAAPSSSLGILRRCRRSWQRSRRCTPPGGWGSCGGCSPGWGRGTFRGLKRALRYIDDLLAAAPGGKRLDACRSPCWRAGDQTAGRDRYPTQAHGRDRRPADPLAHHEALRVVRSFALRGRARL